MQYEQIAALLDKYWEGESTLEEERLLKAYFQAGPVDARLEAAAPLFGMLRAEQAVELPPRANVRPATTRPLWFRRAVAASLAGLLARGFWWWQRPFGSLHSPADRTELQADTYEDPEQAAAEVKAALALVSSKLNQGKKEARKGLKKMEKADKYIPKIQ